MDQDYLDDDDLEDDDEDEFPVLNLDELTKPGGPNGSGGHSAIVIEERTIEDFVQVTNIAESQGKSIHLEGCVIEGSEVWSPEVGVSADESVFWGPIQCRDRRVCKPIRFEDTSFQGPAIFDKSVFEEQVVFADCLLGNDVSFAGTTFKKGISFLFCEVKGQVSFRDATFDGAADFRDSIFSKKVLFRNARFGSAVAMQNTQFKEGYDATNSNLEEIKNAAQTKKVENKATKTVKTKIKKKDFNPWVELDRVSKKEMTRRDLFRGIRNLIPKRDDT